MKKLFALVLCLIMLLSVFPIGFNALAEAEFSVSENLKAEFSADIKGEEIKQGDEFVSSDIKISTFWRDGVESSRTAAVYIAGSKMERIGTDTDIQIVGDLLSDGYLVVVVDYGGSDYAEGFSLSSSAAIIVNAVAEKDKYHCGYTLDPRRTYILPAGYRLIKGIEYFDLLKNGTYGTAEYIRMVWNRYYVNNERFKDNEGNLLKYAETFGDMYNKDGSPLCTTLDLDIMYPANPRDDVTVPVILYGLSGDDTDTINSESRSDFLYALFSGYAGVIYDHEYIPMSRADHYEYFDTCFTLENYLSNHVASAALRCVRYYAEEFGYDSDYVISWGFSKSSSGAGWLSNPERDLTDEYRHFDDVPQWDFKPAEWPEFWDYINNSGVDFALSPEPQPFLTYKDGTPIENGVTVSYAGAGAPFSKQADKTFKASNGPLMTTIGTEDRFVGATIPDVIKAFDSAIDNETMFMVLKNTGHNTPGSYDDEYGVNMREPYWTFLDNHIRAAISPTAPEVCWTTPSSTVIHETNDLNFEIKFSRRMNADSVKAGVKLIRLADNREIPLEFTVMHGATTFRYTSGQIINGSKYRLEINENCLADDGVALDKPYTRTFTLGGDTYLTPTDDAFISKENPDTVYNIETVNAGLVLEDIKKGYIKFTKDKGFKNVKKAMLLLSQNENVHSNVAVYGIVDNAWNENTLTWNNAPLNNSDNTFNADVLAEFDIYGGANIDVTEFIKAQSGDSVSFGFISSSKTGILLSENWDNQTTQTYTRYSDSNVGGQYSFGGSGPYSASVENGAFKVSVNGANGSRVRFNNAMGSGKVLSNSDVGTAYVAKFNVKSDVDTKITVCYHPTAGFGYTLYDEQKFDLKAGEWKEIVYKSDVAESMVDINATALNIKPDAGVTLLFDDLSVAYDASAANVTSIEGAAQNNALQPATLVLYTSAEAEITPAYSSLVQSGDKMHTENTSESFVNGKPSFIAEGTKKGYVKLPIDGFTAGDTAKLTFNANTTGRNTISVYGIAADTTHFAETFDGNITWDNAYANNTSDYGALADKVYGNAPIATVETVGNSAQSIDVTNYVAAMKNSGYSAVTFIMVAEESDTKFTLDFENMETYKNYVANRLEGYSIGITADPENSQNSVFYFDKSGLAEGETAGYFQTVAFTGLLKQNDIWEQSDIGATYNISLKCYRVQPGESDSARFFNAIDKSTSVQHNSITGQERHYYTMDGTKSDWTNYRDTWYKNTFKFTVDQAVVENQTDYTSVNIGSMSGDTKNYIDDIVVERTVGALSITDTALDFGETSVAATVEKTVSVGGTADGLTPNKGAETEIDGLAKMYYTFDKSAVHHIESAALKINAGEFALGNRLLIYALDESLNKTVSWQNAPYNVLNSCGIYGKEPIAEIALTESGRAYVGISEFLKSKAEENSVTIVVCAAEGDGKTEIDSVILEAIYTPDASNIYTAEFKNIKDGDILDSQKYISLALNYPTETEISSAAFLLDGKRVDYGLIKRGDIYYMDIEKLSSGSYTVSATVEFKNGNTATAEPLTFTVSAQYILGDVNGDKVVDTVDLSDMKLYLAGALENEGSFNKAAANLNGDSTVDTVDLSDLKLKLAGA